MTQRTIKCDWLFAAVIALVATAFSPLILAQTYKINNSDSNNLVLSGTAPLHDWTMAAHTLSGTAQFTFGPNETKLQSVGSFIISVPVHNLRSDNSGMDHDAYTALKANQYPSIVFKLNSVEVLPNKPNNYQVKATGNLTIAGVTRNINMNVYCEVNSDNTIAVTGSETLKMTDYQIDPPSKLFGILKAGDWVTINFHLLFTK
jgi:polyisoprenoid-binding protein YceI